MPWVLTSPPEKTVVNVDGENRYCLAIRTDSEGGFTEMLLAMNAIAPEWVPIERVAGAWQPDPHM